MKTITGLFFSFLLILSVYGEVGLITPIPKTINYNEQKALLGKTLFFDPQLSVNGTVSCASCHDIFSGGDDGRIVSTGVYGQQGSINSPTVLNSVFNFVQFWDGRAQDLKDQAKGPIENPVEMGHDFTKLVSSLKEDEYYTKEFSRIYDDGVTKDNIVDAIAEFEKTLITPNSPFDKFLRGDKNALTKEQKKGYKLFINLGCIACHNGVNLGGNLYQKMGIIKKWHYNDSLGKYIITKNKNDKYFFKVPTLRNIALTAPYMHDGSIEKLEDAIKVMMVYQLGITPKHEDIMNIKQFLLSLNGDIPSTMK